ncbi:MAG: PD40 domain-containing protein [Flavobacteriales bacterium]|nr:PD40 domain-containing protein [Flavobacteriales bacterium]
MKNKILLFGLSTLLFASCGESNDQQETKVEKKEVNKELPVSRIPNVSNGAEAYFSPDSKKLIFNGKIGEDTTHYVYTINVDGTDLKKINDKGDDACSFFAPDGKSLIWTSTRDNLDMIRGNWMEPRDYPQGAELYKSDLDGGNIIRLTDNDNYDAEVGYSPDGKTILFTRQIDWKLDLWTMNADGSNQKQITFTPDWQEGGSFIMPDNKTIIYRAWKKSEEGQKTKDMHLFTINVDGSDTKQITTEPGTHWAPYPAPDGEHVAYITVLPPHNYELVLLNLKTGKEKQLTYDKGFDGFPAFSPDGKYLSFSSSRGNKKGNRSLKLYVMDISSLNLGVK